MQFILIFVLGIFILVSAILLNVIASTLGLTTWYEFLKNPKEISVISASWLFIVYPLGLGLCSYYASLLIFNIHS